MQVYAGHRLAAGMSINYKKNTRFMLDQRMFLRTESVGANNMKLQLAPISSYGIREQCGIIYQPRIS